MLVYTALITINLIAIIRLDYRQVALFLSGIIHLSLGSLHAYRLFRPFRFEVFGHQWSQAASLREALIVIPFGLACLWVARQN